MFVDNLKLRTKALIPLAAMALVVLAMVGLGSFQLSAVSGKARDIIEQRDTAAAKLIRAMRLAVEVNYSVFGAIVFDSDAPDGKAAIEEYPKAITGATDLLEAAAALAPDKAAEIARFRDRFQAIAESSKKPMKIAESTSALTKGSQLKAEELDQMAEAARLMGDVDLQARTLVDEVSKFNDAFLAENARMAADLQAQSSQALVTMALVGLVSLGLAGAFSMWLTSSKIAGPLGQLAGRMRALAAGDLSVEIEGQERRDEVGAMSTAVQVFKDNAAERLRIEAKAAADRSAAEAEAHRTAEERAKAAAEQAEVVRRLGDGLKAVAAGDLSVQLGEGFTAAYAQIKDDFNEAMGKLKETVLAVVSSTEAINSGTQEIATASDDLSRRTEQQAASLEETAAALDQITATVKKSAEGANHARDVVSGADADAKNSAVVVRQAVEAMDGIAKSSQQISQIIGVIDEIAFQTNLLALNAGVEAARAGDAGRGFAVVASEVRALAQRSAEAAKEIKGLINSSSTQVDQGVKLVEETGKSLERIMTQVTEINAIVGEIAAGTKEQATALQEVNTAINQMDQTTQQNAAMVEQSTAASQSLSRETMQLSALVSRFQVGQTGNTMRRELEKVAPHAFRAPGKPAAAASRKAPMRSTPKVVNGSAAASDGWQEF